MTLSGIVEWYMLKGDAVNQPSMLDDLGKRYAGAWYFKGRDGDSTIEFNYRKHNNKAFQLLGVAHITRNGKIEQYTTITELKEAFR